METKAKIEEKVIKGKFVSVTLTPENANRIVEVLNSLLKKTKPDRYEEFIIKDLMQALESPDKAEEPIKILSPHPVIEEGKKETKVEKREENELVGLISSEDKVKAIEQVKKRLDPKNEKPMQVFIQESITFGQKQFKIQTRPKSNTVEDFFDWLCENNIIDTAGNPIPKR